MPPSLLSRRLRTLADPVRLRMLHLLTKHELAVTDLTEILNLGQSRVSGHLARMSEDGLVSTRREGRFVYYAGRVDGDGEAAAVCRPALELFGATDEARRDLQAVKAVLSHRASGPPPGTLGKDYLPGRTWEGFAKALLAVLPPRRIADLGIGTGELTLLLAQAARKIIAVDSDRQALARAAERFRAAGMSAKAEFREGDLLDPPIPKGEVDLWVLSQVLHLVGEPGRALKAAFRRLAPGGQVVVLDLLSHREAWVIERLGHVRMGFTESELSRLLRRAGFSEVAVRRVARDRKPPHFVSILGTGRKD
jgi:ArsR family transcriptional regulator